MSPAAARFRAMADLIEKNGDSFGGAFLIFPPGSGDGVVDGVFLSTEEDANTFFLLLRTKLDVAMDAVSKKQQYGGRR